MGKKSENTQYHLIDSRGGVACAKAETKDLNNVDSDWERFILVTDSAKKCCSYANKGDYGDCCVIANNNGIIMWEWFNNDQWNNNL